ncbi:MAG TPA: AAA family ATPase [Pirellulales bacterium]|nr:AAA family ATPase [Pirellulales bacterium]
MSFGDEAIESLREALKVSPENIPLRLHLASALTSIGRLLEAEAELRDTLSFAAENFDVKMALADCYYRQDKVSQAMVIVEDIVNKRDVPAKAHVLYARLLLHEGKVPDAVAHYKLGLELDPDAEDEDLSQQLGVVPEDEAGDVFEGRLRESHGAGGAKFETEIERPKIKFEDVGGMDELKEEIGMKIIYPLKHPEMYKAYGKPIGGGILMYGPPGCGKTYLARATAGEINAAFISVGISDVLEMWIGNSERNLRELFQQARYNKPCVIFFDEVDALGGRRSDMSGGGARQLINQFLSEMDGIESNNDGLLILAATNAPWHVDPAFRRPGRFDRVLFVPPPDRTARAEILKIQLKDKPVDRVDFDQLAKKTDDFSGADLKATIDQAIEGKLREAIKAGVPQPLGTKDLLSAIKAHRPTTREWFATARNYALYSNQGGVYDDVLKYLKM